MAKARPSKDPNDHVDGDYALGTFYEAWVGPMERRHRTFTTAFMQDASYPGIVRVAMALCPFVQSMLNDRWHILDQNDDVVHNDRTFRLARRLAILFARHRDIDPFACDLLVEILRINDRKAGRHALVDRSYEPFDTTAQIFQPRVYGFADKVLRALPEGEDLAGYELPKRFAWPIQPRRGDPGVVVLPLPAEAADLGAFADGAIRSMAAAMVEAGHRAADVAAAVSACARNPAEIHRHVLYAGADGTALSEAASRDAFKRLGHASHMRSPQGVLGLPGGRDAVQVAIVRREVLDALRGFHLGVLMQAGMGFVDKDRTVREGAPPLVPLRNLAMYGIHTMIGLASNPVWLADPEGLRTHFYCGQTMVVVDDDAEAVAAIVRRLNPVLAGDPAFKPVLDARWPRGDAKAH